MARFARTLILVIVAAAIVAGLAYAFWPRPVPVDLGTVRDGAFEVTVDDEGVTRIRDIYRVSAPISGTVLRSPREVGDEVTAHETLIAVIEPIQPGLLDARARRVAEAAVAAAEAAVRLAEAQIQEAEAERAFMVSELQRVSQLARRNVASQRDLDEARLNIARAETHVASAEASLEVRRRELERARAELVEPTIAGLSDVEAVSCCVYIRAPVDGRVLTIPIESEQVVQAGTMLADLGDPTDLEVVAELLSRDAVRVVPGQMARIDGWGGAESFVAEVERVEPAAFTEVSALGIEEQRVKTVLRFSDEPAARAALGHEYRVIVRIAVYQNEAAALVPLSALFRRGDDWAVFVRDGEIARERVVEIGERNNREAEVLSGLVAGDEVVLHASDQVADGVAVISRDELD
ncbi:MAG: HlyD family efflux transporter periplasmic adaptor subunit [Pseudomonadota bacterium]